MIANNLRRLRKAFGLVLFVLFVLLLSACEGVPLLDPKGPIGEQEKLLLFMSVGLMLIVVVPVFVMAIWFGVRYRESNAKATYKPKWEGSLRIEAVIWLIPLAIVVVLSYLTIVKTIELDPYKPIESDKPTLRVQVVSLDWNWLFIYPDYDIATVNQLYIPAGAPVAFDITSATVMTSFFIPDLGSQIYAMAGMVTKLNLMADHPGTFTGQNMNYSGFGYGTMFFPTNAIPADEFATWAQTAKNSQSSLTLAAFNELNTPQSNYPATTYASVEPDLFGKIVGKFMGWQGDHGTMDMSGHEGGNAPAEHSTDAAVHNEASPMPMTH